MVPSCLKRTVRQRDITKRPERREKKDELNLASTPSGGRQMHTPTVYFAVTHMRT